MVSPHPDGVFSDVLSVLSCELTGCFGAARLKQGKRSADISTMASPTSEQIRAKVEKLGIYRTVR